MSATSEFIMTFSLSLFQPSEQTSERVSSSFVSFFLFRGFHFTFFFWNMLGQLKFLLAFVINFESLTESSTSPVDDVAFFRCLEFAVNVNKNCFLSRVVVSWKKLAKTKPIMNLAFSTLALVLVALAGLAASSGDVLELTDANFDSKIKEHEVALVKFCKYTPVAIRPVQVTS